MPSNRLKILCLHGFTSNGAVHAHQVRKITEALQEYEFIFPDGPHQVDYASQSDLSKPQNQLWTNLVNSHSSSGHRAWWFARETQETNGEFVGLETSLKFIGELSQRKGPFHAIWGFSQGACFAGMLCALLQGGLADHPLRKYLPSDTVTPLAGVIFSGFRARFPQYDSIYAQGIDLPMMHIMGAEDDKVTNESSETLIKICSNSVVLKHDRGHAIPRDNQDQAKVIEFIRRHVLLDGIAQLQSSI